MNETSSRNIVLLRAFEAHPDDPLWTDTDRTWANDTARQVAAAEGAQSAGAFVARRAALGVQRLVSRDAALGDLLQSVQWRWWLGPLIVLGAFVAGLLTDLVGADKVINLLAPPILAIVAWNLLVYLAMPLSAIPGFFRRRGMAGGAQATARGTSPVHRFFAGILARQLQKRVANKGTAATQAFAATWLSSSAPLTARRVAAVMHFSAAALAAGVLAAMYFRGLGLSYQAGWESTFLNPSQVAALLGALLAPASWLSGIALPGAAGFAEMQLTEGPGVNAARWIHLLAITMFLLVITPRLLLGLFNAMRATRLREHFGLDTSAPYFESLARVWRGDAASLVVVPYSYGVAADQRNNLGRLLGQVHGADAQITMTDSVTPAEEDHWQLPAGQPTPAIVLLLYAMTATPEAETHGRFAHQVRTGLSPSTVLVAVIDESRFRERFAQQPGRIDQRRRAWQAVLGARALAPVFVDLSQPGDEAIASALTEAINAAPGIAAGRPHTLAPGDADMPEPAAGINA